MFLFKLFSGNSVKFYQNGASVIEQVVSLLNNMTAKEVAHRNNLLLIKRMKTLCSH